MGTDNNSATRGIVSAESRRSARSPWDESAGLLSGAGHSGWGPHRWSRGCECEASQWGEAVSGAERYDRDRNRFVHYRRGDGGIGAQEEDFVWDLYEDQSGTIWVGTYLSGLFRYDRAADRFIQYRHDPANPDSLSDDRGYAIHEDRGGLLWIGTARGLDRFDREPGRFVHFCHDSADPATLAGERVQLIYEDRAGRLWVATYGTGVNLFDQRSGRATRYVHDPGNPQSIDQTTRIHELYEDTRGFLAGGVQPGRSGGAGAAEEAGVGKRWGEVSLRGQRSCVGLSIPNAAKIKPPEWVITRFPLLTNLIRYARMRSSSFNRNPLNFNNDSLAKGGPSP